MSISPGALVTINSANLMAQDMHYDRSEERFELSMNSVKKRIVNTRVWSRRDKIDYINTFIDSHDGKMLEIGPNLSPIWDKSTFPELKYLEAVDAEGLRERGKKAGVASPIELVDFVFDGSKGFKGSIDNTSGYDVISSSHVIEHIPDFVGHLSDIEASLEAGGKYTVVVPDKNMVFDKLRPATSLGSVISAHLENKSALEAAIDSIYYSVKHTETGRGWWNANSEELLERRHPDAGTKIKNLCVGHQSKVDGWTGHYHVFTPMSFTDLVLGTAAAGMHSLSLTELVSTGHMDIIAVLTKDNGASNSSAEKIHKSLISQNYKYLNNYVFVK